jgi:hypothetical protein
MLNVVLLNVIKLNVVKLNVVMLNVVKLNVIMLNVIMLNVIILSVVAPSSSSLSFEGKFSVANKRFPRVQVIPKSHSLLPKFIIFDNVF